MVLFSLLTYSIAWLILWFYSAVFGEGSGVKFDSAEAIATPPAADAKVIMLRKFFFLVM